jgi:release factor glutamine methyltransferase
MLAPGGVLALEVEAGAARAVEALLRAAGFEAIEVRRDYAGRERIVSGIRPSLPPPEPRR